MNFLVGNIFLENFFSRDLAAIHFEVSSFWKQTWHRSIRQGFKIILNLHVQFYCKIKKKTYSRELVRRHIRVLNVKGNLWENIHCASMTCFWRWGTPLQRNMTFLKSNMINTAEPDWMKHSLSIKYMISNLTKY